MQVAIFDFDGTLYEKETFNSLMKHLEEHPNYQAEYKKFYRDILPPFIGHKLKVYPTHKMRANSMQLYVNALDRLSVNELNMFFSDLAQKMRKDFNPLIIESFKEHDANNVYIIHVYGAFTNLLTYVTTEYDFNEVNVIAIPIIIYHFSNVVKYIEK